MSPLTLPDEFKKQLHEKLKNWFDKNKNHPMMLNHERAQIQRLIDYIEVVDRGHVSTEDDKDIMYHDFKSFYVQYDIRRNKNFQETFPEMAEWYNSIEVDQTIPDVRMTDGRITHYEYGEYRPDIKPIKKK
jgi:ABC-type sulfate/molybdate transport systems ATPase subunit